MSIDRNVPVSIGEADKVTSWPFKDPEKTSAWRESDLAPPKDVPVHMVDYELEKAKKRTAEIKTLMSAEGALGLPPLLEAARLKWGIPDSAFDCQAVFDRIHIFPLDFEGKSADKDTWGKTGIHMPEATKLRDKQNGHRGVLLSMGLTAADHCVSHGIELGHVVRTIRNAPHAQEFARLDSTAESMFYLVMRDGDLTGSETLHQDLRAGRVSIVDDGGEFSYAHNIEGRKKRSALVRDNW